MEELCPLHEMRWRPSIFGWEVSCKSSRRFGITRFRFSQIFRLRLLSFFPDPSTEASIFLAYESLHRCSSGMHLINFLTDLLVFISWIWLLAGRFFVLCRVVFIFLVILISGSWVISNALFSYFLRIWVHLFGYFDFRFLSNPYCYIRGAEVFKFHNILGSIRKGIESHRLAQVFPLFLLLIFLINCRFNDFALLEKS